MLAAEIWHWWIGVVLLGVSVLTVVALAIGYLKNVTAQRYPQPQAARRATDRPPRAPGRRGRRPPPRPLHVPAGGDGGRAAPSPAAPTRRRSCCSPWPPGADVDAVHVDHGLRPLVARRGGAGGRARRDDRGAVPLPARRRRAGTEPRSTGTRRSPRRTRPRRRHRPHRRRPGRDRADQPAAWRRHERARRHATRHPPPDPRPAHAPRRGALVLANGLTPVVDPTNADPRFVRNRVRARVAPAARRRSPAVTSPPSSPAVPPCSPTTTSSSTTWPAISTPPTPAPWRPRRARSPDGRSGGG